MLNIKFRLQAAALVFALAVLSGPLQAQSVEQGVQLFNVRKYPDARAILLPYGERDANAAYYLGRIEMENDDAGKAAEWFERAVKMNPKSAVYYDWLGRAYGMQAQRASAFRLPFLARKTKNAWETALVIDPDNLDVRDDLIIFYTRAPGFVGGSKEKARDMALEIRKRNPYRGSIAAANLCAADKDTLCVERELQGMITTYPDSPAVYASLAAFYANQKQFDKSFAVSEERLKTKPDEPTTLYQVGRTASISGQNLDRGEEAFKDSAREPNPGARTGASQRSLPARHDLREERRQGSRSRGISGHTAAPTLAPGSEEGAGGAQVAPFFRSPAI